MSGAFTLMERPSSELEYELQVRNRNGSIAHVSRIHQDHVGAVARLIEREIATAFWF
jgi:hypothetical protein